MLCVGCILHDKGAPGGGVGVKGGDWYLAIVGCCRAAGAGDYDSSCPAPAPHRNSHLLTGGPPSLEVSRQ